MTTTHTPPRTRSQAAMSAAAEASAAQSQDSASAAETNAFEAVYLELQKLREERRRERQEWHDFRKVMEDRLRERDAALTRLEERLATQLSPSNNISAAGNSGETSRVLGMGEGACAGRATRENSAETLRVLGAGEGACAGRATSGNPHGPMRALSADGSAERVTRENAFATSCTVDAGGSAFAERAARGLKLKPDTYDGTAPLREFLAQFLLIASANQWTDSERTVVLASCLRGKARSLLDSCFDGIESLAFAELKAKLELRFGESELAQSFYLQFTNRKQSPGEDFAALGADLERLSRKAYPECTHEVRDKVACSQFVTGLNDGFVRHALQVEGVTSLRVAIERARTLKLIEGSSFPGKRDAALQGLCPAQGEVSHETPKAGECWKCGVIGHFRSECPTQQEDSN